MNNEEKPELKPISQKHPRALQILMQEAVKTLTEKQAFIWTLWNNDRYTQDEIADFLKISRDTVKTQIKGIERKLMKHIKANMGAYLLIKMEQKIMNGDE